MLHRDCVYEKDNAMQAIITVTPHHTYRSDNNELCMRPLGFLTYDVVAKRHFDNERRMTHDAKMPLILVFQL